MIAVTDAAVRESVPATVLIVDDNTTNRYIVTSWLRRAGHEVVEAGDGAGALAALAALAAAAHRPPELAIVDVGLPDMSGFDLCERIKADPATAGIPVIHMSATAVAVDDRTQGLNRGADGYLVEPLDPDELLATITAVLRYARARRQAEDLAGRLALLNRATLELYRAADFAGFAAAVASGAARVMSASALGVFLSPTGPAVAVTVAAPGAEPCSSSVRAELLEGLARRALGGRTGAATAVVTAEVWDAGLKARAPGGDAEMAVVRTKTGRPPVCVAVDAAAVRTPEDRTLLLQFAQAAALALESLRSYAEEHALALALQRSFLPDPDHLPAVPGIDLAVRYVPATSQTEVGGDFYEALRTRHGLLLAIGDVVGHSIEAAVLMGEVRHALRAYAVAGHPPEQILELLERLLGELRPALTTVTLCLVLVEPGGRHVQVSNAGHVPPLLLEPGDGARLLAEHGPLLGIGLPQPPPTRYEIAAPSRLLLITDGLIEISGEALDESLARLTAAARSGPDGLEPLADFLLDTLGKEKGDDIALMLCRLAAPPTADPP